MHKTEDTTDGMRVHCGLHTQSHNEGNINTNSPSTCFWNAGRSTGAEFKKEYRVGIKPHNTGGLILQHYSLHDFDAFYIIRIKQMKGTVNSTQYMVL